MRQGVMQAVRSTQTMQMAMKTAQPWMLALLRTTAALCLAAWLVAAERAQGTIQRSGGIDPVQNVWIDRTRLRQLFTASMKLGQRRS